MIEPLNVVASIHHVGVEKNNRCPNQALFENTLWVIAPIHWEILNGLMYKIRSEEKAFSFVGPAGLNPVL